MNKKLWTINGKIWHCSGDITYLSQGQYTIGFSDVKNYKKPDDINIFINVNELHEINSKYKYVESGNNTNINISGLTDVTNINSDLIINNLNGNIQI